MTPPINPAMDAGIPLLTEVLDAEPADTAAAAPPVAGPTVAEPDWEALERKLTENVLHALSERIDFVLEQRLRDGLAEALDGALRGLTGELRKGLHRTLDEVVARAVAQEVAKLKAHPLG
jgi:hypothetical protein